MLSRVWSMSGQLVCGLSVVILFSAPLLAAETAAAAVQQAPQRVVWKTSRVVGSPEAAPPYQTQVAFPKLTFNEPLTFAMAPGSLRIFIAERAGKILAFTPSKDVRSAITLLELKRPVYGMAFHPQFSKNGYVYITSITEPNPGPDGSRVSRFQVTGLETATPRIDPASEQTVLTWPSGGHNGGCIKFGPDGYLYISTGDGSGIADELKTGQNISDLLGSVLRIDVDHSSAGRNYSIPVDNPFTKRAGTRPEIFAYGIRQMWKMDFDAEGHLWAGEIGQDLWEAIHLVVSGGNYGWSVQESNHPFRPELPRGPTPILPPIVEHSHADFRSITGGNIYTGKRLPELVGMYVYADYDTGKIWGLRYDHRAKKVTEHRELADGVLRFVEIGKDHGELYFVDHIGGQLHELVPAPPRENAPAFPRKLSETGLFASTKDHTPAPGVIPYEVNSELWSDGAIKSRFLALPGTGQIDFDAIEYPQPAPGAPRGWRFPDGTVAVKTFSIEMEQGNPRSRRRLETRLLHFQQTPGTQEVGDQVWNGYTYVWNDDQTDAELLDAAGRDLKLAIKDATAPGGVREQVWHFPSRAQCSMCHTMPGKFVLGLNTLQLNRPVAHESGTKNQLALFEHLGLFSKPLPESPAQLPRLVSHTDTTASLDDRARAYLHSNCAHCHRKWGGGNAEFQLLSTLPMGDLGIVGVKPAHGSLGLQNPALLVPGSPDRSLLWHRMTLQGLGRMPHIASTEVDQAAVKLIRDWITQLPEQAAK